MINQHHQPVSLPVVALFLGGGAAVPATFYSHGGAGTPSRRSPPQTGPALQVVIRHPGGDLFPFRPLRGGCHE